MDDYGGPDEPDTAFCPICHEGFTFVEQVFDHRREDHEGASA